MDEVKSGNADIATIDHLTRILNDYIFSECDYLDKPKEEVYQNKISTLALYDDILPVLKKYPPYNIESGNHPVYAEIKKYDMKESQKIAERVDISTPKNEATSLLQSAFERCPYNPGIYTKAAQIGLFDQETQALAEKYGCM